MKNNKKLTARATLWPQATSEKETLKDEFITIRE